MSVKLPREDGAWWIAVICWVAGWAAAREAAWEPLALAATVFLLFTAAQLLRSVRRLLKPDPAAAKRKLFLTAALLLPAAFAMVLYVLRTGGEWTALAPLFPAVLYSGAIVTGTEKAPFNRVLGIVALTGLAPATYALLAGSMDATAWMLWATLGGYYILSGILVMARLRKSDRALWIVRTLSPLTFALVLLCPARGSAHLFLAAVFLLLTLKAWTVRTTGPRIDPRTVGQVELLHSAIVLLLVVQALWSGAE